MQSLKEHQMLIGEGGDAWFVVHRDEIFNGRAVVGYKIFKQEKRRRGRNSPRLEHDIQLQAFEVLNKSNLLFKVPQPFGYAELTEDKLISMENLNALSVDDLQRGRGALPNWLREPGMIDQFCEELKKALDLLHSQNIFHRDMHPGNVMVSLKRENNISPFGYIIDFGLSGAEFDEQYAYKKEVAGQVFTFKDDYAIIQQVSNILKRLWRKEHASKSNDAGTDPANPSGAPL
jgi:serine/threonine protein kinase